MHHWKFCNSIEKIFIMVILWRNFYSLWELLLCKYFLQQSSPLISLAFVWDYLQKECLQKPFKANILIISITGKSQNKLEANKIWFMVHVTAMYLLNLFFKYEKKIKNGICDTQKNLKYCTSTYNILLELILTLTM